VSSEAGPTAVLDRPATLQQGTRQFSALYESNAYLVYNLTLRVACDRAVAIESARAAFLSALGTPAREEDLVEMAVGQALAVAPDRPTTPNGAGDAEAEAMLAATATLPPPARAALALTGLTDASAGEVAATMNVTEEVADGLLSRAFEALARELGKEPEEAESDYRSWLLVEPPIELWETLYPDFYRALERRLREGRNGTAVPVDGDRTSRRARRGARRTARRAARSASEPTGERRQRPRWKRRALWAVSILALGGGGFAAASQTGLIALGSESSSRPATRPPASTFGSRLSPDRLDRLRIREVGRARDLATRQELRDRRRKARRRALDARRRREARTRQRQRARRRGAQQRRQREQAPAQQQGDTPRPERTSRPPRRTNPGGGGGNSGGGRDTPRQQDQTDECVLNESDGTYICPR
jgi:hypothetical protein